MGEGGYLIYIGDMLMFCITNVYFVTLVCSIAKVTKISKMMAIGKFKIAADDLLNPLTKYYMTRDAYLYEFVDKQSFGCLRSSNCIL